MCRSDQPFTHHGLSSLGVSGQSVKLLLGGIPLHYFELPLYVVLHDILELGLYLLGLSEDIPELGCQSLMHSLLHPGLRLLRVCLLGFLEVALHLIKQLLYALLILSVDLHYLTDLLSPHCGMG